MGTPYEEFSGVKILSPQKTKFANILYDTLGDRFQGQVMVMFGYPKSAGGGGVFSANFVEGEISVEWQNDQVLKIYFPENAHILRQDSATQLFDNHVNLIYD